jgi:ubiquinone/menaquinone biosynthesis C-methylase UbiE/uncharacterized protein YbaR (Trm112 family)
MPDNQIVELEGIDSLHYGFPPANKVNPEVVRERIYEQLGTRPQPSNYSGKIPWIVQQQIAATNGIHFMDTIGTLSEYPIPEIPVDQANTPGDLLLDIGNGWGRWLVAAAKKDYIPVGIDIRLEFCETARNVLQANGKNGYSLVADLQNLPFLNNVFSVVWSFSVIQHTHLDRFTRCLSHIERILADNAYCFLEFPNRNGIRNRFGPAAKPNSSDFDSWDVRYYTPEEYEKIFRVFFDNYRYFNHSVLGIGILPGDGKYAKGLKNKAIITASRTLSNLATLIPKIKSIADSIYIKSVKHGTKDNAAVEAKKSFHSAHALNPSDNLNIVHLLRCPVSGEEVHLSDDRTEVISRVARLAYPVKNNIPIMIASEARSFSI